MTVAVAQALFVGLLLTLAAVHAVAASVSGRVVGATDGTVKILSAREVKHPTWTSLRGEGHTSPVMQARSALRQPDPVRNTLPVPGADLPH